MHSRLNRSAAIARSTECGIYYDVVAAWTSHWTHCIIPIAPLLYVDLAALQPTRVTQIDHKSTFFYNNHVAGRAPAD